MIWPFRRKRRRSAIHIDVVSTQAPNYITRESHPEWRQAADVLARHFDLSESIRATYADRYRHGTGPTVALCLDLIALAPKAVKAFRTDHHFQQVQSKQLALKRSKQQRKKFTLPSHRGYQQLAIIRDKEKNYGDAIRLCKAAKRQGWNGDWDTRIARYEDKRKKA